MNVRLIANSHDGIDQLMTPASRLGEEEGSGCRARRPAGSDPTGSGNVADLVQPSGLARARREAMGTWPR